MKNLLRFASTLCIVTLPMFGQQPSGSHTSAPTTPGIAARSLPAGLSEVQLLIDKGQLDEALKETKAMAQQHPAPKGLERMRGKVLYLKADFEDADSAFQKALASDPEDKESVQLRGVTLFRMGKPAAAIPLLEQSHKNLRICLKTRGGNLEGICFGGCFS